MAKFDYSRPAATAKRQLDRFGQDGELSRSTPGGYEPETGPTAPVELQSPCTVALLDFDNRQIDGELIRIGDRRALIAPDVSFEPQAGDSLTVGSDVLQVVRNRPVSPAGFVVLHDCVVRVS
ncbi:hypothetical protein [Comamonas odontotermitis]|uniref:hypothetical protein n=1 Tax=Comamonas odontotermitis TaxID=379895 RepID=UPI001CC702A8|nr:hypothetical protein [Comamonas odontotermitis]UBB18365.1 hypothetical protein LAD35_06930 [Comamonas odontotermitis]